MEAIVSLLILGILMTTIVAIIRFSMVLTGNALSNASGAQDRYNALIHENYSGATVELTITSNLPYGIIASHNVIQSPDESTAFFPVDEED